MKCELCKKLVGRTARTSFLDYVKSIIGIYPWRCTHCGKKLYRVHPEQFALGVCRNEKGDMRFGNRVIRIGEAVAGHFSTTERGERRDRG